jgi:serine/threonine protein kinase
MAAAPVFVIDDLFEYSPLVELGRGSYGTTYKGRELKEPKREVAVKVINKQLSKKEEKLIEREKIPLTLEHPNIIEMLHYSETEYAQHMKFAVKMIKQHFLVMELMESDLIGYCNSEEPSCDERLHIMQQVIKGVMFLHGKHVLHRDLKPGNLLVKGTVYNVVIIKITDFGISKVISDNETLYGSDIGAPDWRAPELFKGSQYGYPVDIFSLGHVFLALMVCEPGHCLSCKELCMFNGE